MRLGRFIIVTTALCWLAPGARAAAGFHYEGDYQFSSNGYKITVLGREVGPNSQSLYVKFSFYAVYDACEEMTNSLSCDNLLLLENEEGVAHEPASVHILLNQQLYETSQPFVKYKYLGDFAGPCKLVVKLGGGRTVRLDLGPAEYDFFRMGTVTAREGVDVHVAPNYASPVLCHLRRGDTFYFTGRNSYFWPYPDLSLYDHVEFDERVPLVGAGGDVQAEA